MTVDEELLIKSRKRAEVKIAFYFDLAAYIIVNTILILLWYFGDQGFPWFVFVLFFWGLGVASRGMSFFRHSPSFDRMAEEEYKRMVEREY